MKKILIIVLLVIGSVNLVPVKNKTPKAPVLMISLDGFRADKLDNFLRDNPNSYLQKEFVEVGVKAEYMQPSFPTLTFPNHYTIVTGLYMESHDIVGNSAYDSVYDQKINFLRDSNKNDVKWWNKSEPIWFTAKKQGLKTSSFFWAGSEVWTRHPDIFLSYNEDFEYESRCDEVVNWFKKFKLDFGTLYFDEPDHTGHSYGPDSEEYSKMIYKLDDVIGYLLKKLEESNLLDTLNIVIVSDHGMATMKNKTIIVKDVVDVNLINANKTIYGIVSNIYPKNDSVKPIVYNSLKNVANLKVYYKEEVPANFHFQNSNRIAPIVAIADEGYVMNTVTQTLAGNHGFDNDLETMRAIFLARGPDFKRNAKITGLKNVDVYPMLCELLKIQCNPNNGSLLPYQNAMYMFELNSDSITLSTFSSFQSNTSIIPQSSSSSSSSATSTISTSTTPQSSSSNSTLTSSTLSSSTSTLSNTSLSYTQSTTTWSTTTSSISSNSSSTQTTTSTNLITTFSTLSTDSFSQLNSTYSSNMSSPTESNTSTHSSHHSSDITPTTTTTNTIIPTTTTTNTIIPTTTTTNTIVSTTTTKTIIPTTTNKSASSRIFLNIYLLIIISFLNFL